MTAPKLFVIHTDGASRGNPGAAAFAFTIQVDDTIIVEEAGLLGNMTNNQAEYIALVRALEHAQEFGTSQALLIKSDSELMVKQMKGEYRVKDASLKTYYEQALRLQALFPEVTLQHVRRADNRHADRLCNEVLDGKRESSSKLPSRVAKEAAPESVKETATAKDEVQKYLQEVLTAAKVGPTPSAAKVCEQIWLILEKHRLLK